MDAYRVTGCLNLREVGGGGLDVSGEVLFQLLEPAGAGNRDGPG
ncbi:hypothetical protein ACWFRK_39010 [Streptomyces sp. NPDC055157]